MTATVAASPTGCGCHLRFTPQCGRAFRRRSPLVAAFSLTNIIDDGSDVDDAVQFGVGFAAAGMDFISTSRGGKFDDAKQPAVGWSAYPYTGPSGYECMPQFISDLKGPFGRNVAATAAIREAIRASGRSTPVICTGGVRDFEMAEHMLAHPALATSLDRRGNRWPTPIGFAKYSSDAARR